jgi:hypothetical protein
MSWQVLARENSHRGVMLISRAELSFVALSDTSAIGSHQNTSRFLRNLNNHISKIYSI